MLFDGLFSGQPRKMLAQAARNGFFFVRDRTNGSNLVSKGYVGVNWSQGLDAKGQPIPNPAKMPQIDGSLINTPAGGGINWPARANPETGLFYVNARKGYSIAYLTDTDESRVAMEEWEAASSVSVQRLTTRPAISSGAMSIRAAALPTAAPAYLRPPASFYSLETRRAI